METLIFVPGIMGSVLRNTAGDFVWPPTVREAVSGIRNPERLLDPDLVPTDIIRRVCLRNFYAPLVDDLDACGFAEGGDAKALVCHAYDWRKDLLGEADLLAERLDELHVRRPGRLKLMGHSMGGLIVRLLLESGRFDDRPWFASLATAFFLAVPHRGAPMALARLLGLGGSAGGLAAADVRRLAADERYPAVYQLLPPPGDVICWDRDLAALDVYDAAVGERLGLRAGGLDSARRLHESLAFERRPGHVRYLLFAGTGFETAVRIELTAGRPILREGIDAGDGTVPLWSAAGGGQQRHAAPGEHSSVFTSRTIRELVYRFLGAQLPIQPFAAGATPEAALIVRDLVVTRGTPQAVLLVPDRPLERLRAELLLERAEPAEPPVFAPVDAPMRLDYQGAAMTQLQLFVPATALQEKGLYRLRLTGGAVSPEPASFVVQD
jgi:hypothetical protein